ncbi:helix-turn-helix domain-containing protein [Pseudomonas asplenii]|uniref:Transcriptional regulator, contains XRE-family HTH domain n=1 Tax=Pseudomonas asplenii TaxID=53407 RepID=A0A1H6L9P7_9PSED|nr:helix-turn-helix transcriptional regulator [Pseudomonas fuscovaginae]SEH85068.1 Transcriptional regulator, contains XRE-family HTH domain [Pseudomonas fuscovaginae]
MHLSEEIGSRLQEERKRCGMTQNQLAEALGISKRTQANYESGSSDATASYLSNVAVQFSFDVPYILTGRRTTAALDSLSEVEDFIVQQYRSIPEDDQRAIRRFVKAMADDVVKGST